MIQPNNRRKSNEEIHFVLKVSLIKGQGREHLGCPLRVTDISQIIVTVQMVYNCIDHGWLVVLTHFKETVVEEFIFVLDWVQVFVETAVDAASIITEVDIESTVHKLDSKRFLSNPYKLLGVLKQTVLH